MYPNISYPHTRRRRKPVHFMVYSIAITAVLLILVFMPKPSAGPETLAAEKAMYPGIGQTMEDFSSQFGEPSDTYYPEIHGEQYAGMVYKHKDGQVRVLCHVRSNKVERIFSEALD